MLCNSVLEKNHVNIVVKFFFLVTQCFLPFHLAAQKSASTFQASVDCARVTSMSNHTGRTSLVRSRIFSRINIFAKRQWLFSVCVTVSFLIMCACLARSESTPGNTGITGVVMVSPIRPGPIRKGSEFPTAAPLQNARFEVTSRQRVVTTFTTDAAGRFQITLKPGQYSISLAENRFPRPCGPFEISVAQGKMTEVQWRCDSGMR